MRSWCLDCARKHLASAVALLRKFVETGDSLYRFLAAGEAEQAEAESTEIDYEFAKRIRVIRCRIMKSDKDGQEVFGEKYLETLIEEATIISRETGVNHARHTVDMANLPAKVSHEPTELEEVLLHLAVATAYQKEIYFGYPWYIRLAKGELTRAVSYARKDGHPSFARKIRRLRALCTLKQFRYVNLEPLICEAIALAGRVEELQHSTSNSKGFDFAQEVEQQ